MKAARVRGGGTLLPSPYPRGTTLYTDRQKTPFIQDNPTTMRQCKPVKFSFKTNNTERPHKVLFIKRNKTFSAIIYNEIGYKINQKYVLHKITNKTNKYLPVEFPKKFTCTPL